MRTIIKMVSSGLYVGYSPVMPGTIGSIWGVLIYLQLIRHPHIFIFATALLVILGFLICEKAEEVFGKKDSRRIVIDEIASMCLVYLFTPPTWPMLIVGFVLLRIFDTLKPWPIRKLEGIGKGRGVMLDDIGAALYTIIILIVMHILSL